MRLLVSGATGFVGYHFVEKAVLQGHEVYCLVRVSSDVSKLNMLNLNLVMADLSKTEEVQRAFREVKPDVVVHCAGCVVAQQLEDFTEQNVQATLNICQSSLDSKVSRLVYISSVDVNSANEQIPIKEDLPYKGVNLYGESKIEAEKTVIEFQQKGLDSVVLRPTTIIGEGEPHGMPKLLPLLVKRRLPFPKFKDLKDQIHIVYIGNLVQAMFLAIDKAEALNQVFTICDDEPTHIHEALELMVEELGCKPPRKVPQWLVKSLLILPPLKRAFYSIFRDWEYDISKAKKLLAYQPEVSSEEGIRRTVRYWREEQLEQTK
jgi:nucleoside-diphosphate-sugar epimerase